MVRSVFGGPGEKSGILLRLFQALLSLLSLLALVFAPGFSDTFGVRFLLNSQGAQVIWNLIVVCMDCRTTAIFGGGNRRRPSVHRVRVSYMLDMCMSVFSMGTLSSAAAVLHVLWRASMCKESPATCRMILVSIVMAFLAWSLQTFLSLIMLFVAVGSL